MTSFGAAESNRKAEAGIKTGKNHPGPTKKVLEGSLTQCYCERLWSFLWGGQGNTPGTAMPGFSPIAAATDPRASNGQGQAPSESQTQTPPYSKGAPASGHCSKMGNSGPTVTGSHKVSSEGNWKAETTKLVLSARRRTTKSRLEH